MFINATVLSVALLQINFMYTILHAEEVEIHSMYSSIIKSQPKFLEGKTEFCQSRDINLWVRTCQVALKELQDEDKFKDMYVDYRFYSQEEVSSKCQRKLVNLPQNHLNLYEDVMKYIQSTPIPVITQHMAICHARPVVVTKNPEHAPERIREMIAITVIKDRLLLIFQRVENGNPNQYFPYKAYLTNLSNPKTINPILFTQHPPTSIKTELQNFIEVSTPQRTSNIVYWSDRFLFARLCVMAIRLSQYPNSKFSVGALCSEKPAPVTKEVYMEELTEVYPQGTFQTDVYPCSSVDISQYTTWYSVKDIYALMEGPEDNSLIVLEHKLNPVHTSIILTPVELIENVSEEFLNEIYIPEYFEDDCTPPPSEEQESCGSNPI